MDPTPRAAGPTSRTPSVVCRWLGRSIRICVTCFPHLLIATLILMVPLLVFEWSLTRGPSTRAERAFSPILIRVFFQSIEAGVGFAVQGIVVMLVFQKLRRKRMRPFHSIGVGLSRLPVLLGIVVCVVLVFAACALPVGLLTHSAPWLVFALLVAVIPYVVWYVASTAAVVERIGVFRSLARSAELTKGRRFRIFAAFAAFLVLALLIGEGVARAFALFSSSPPATGSGPEEPLRALLLRAIGTVLGGLMGSVLPVVIYHDLRESKEGIGLEQLASSFDRVPPT